MNKNEGKKVIQEMVFMNNEAYELGSETIWAQELEFNLAEGTLDYGYYKNKDDLEEFEPQNWISLSPELTGKIKNFIWDAHKKYLAAKLAGKAELLSDKAELEENQVMYVDFAGESESEVIHAGFFDKTLLAEIERDLTDHPETTTFFVLLPLTDSGEEPLSQADVISSFLRVIKLEWHSRDLDLEIGQNWVDFTKAFFQEVADKQGDPDQWTMNELRVPSEVKLANLVKKHQLNLTELKIIFPAIMLSLELNERRVGQTSPKPTMSALTSEQAERVNLLVEKVQRAYRQLFGRELNTNLDQKQSAKIIPLFKDR